MDIAPNYTVTARCSTRTTTRTRISSARAAAARSSGALLKATEPERPVCTRCGFVFYLDPKIAVGTIIQIAERPDRARPARDRAGLRQVGVSRAATSTAASR